MGKLVPYPSYVAHAVMSNQLYNATFVARDDTGKYSFAYSIHFQKGGQDFRVCWNTQEGSNFIFTASSPLTVYNIMGNPVTYQPQSDGTVTIQLSTYPIYVYGSVSLVAPTVTTPVYAVSNIDFTGTQGENGWTYGYWIYDPKLRTQNFTLMTLTHDQWNYYMEGPFWYLQIYQDGGLPSTTNNQEVWAVRRWTSSVSGLLEVSGSISRGADGTGTGALILQDGIVLQNWTMAPSTSMQYDVILKNVQVGTIIDFALRPIDLNNEYDSTTYTAVIAAPSSGTSFTSKPSNAIKLN